MKLFQLELADETIVAINPEAIAAIVPEDSGVQVILVSGDTFAAKGTLNSVADRLTNQGWRKG